MTPRSGRRRRAPGRPQRGQRGRTAERRATGRPAAACWPRSRRAPSPGPGVRLRWDEGLRIDATPPVLGTPGRRTRPWPGYRREPGRNAPWGGRGPGRPARSGSRRVARPRTGCCGWRSPPARVAGCCRCSRTTPSPRCWTNWACPATSWNIPMTPPACWPRACGAAGETRRARSGRAWPRRGSRCPRVHGHRPPGRGGSTAGRCGGLRRLARAGWLIWDESGTIRLGPRVAAWNAAQLTLGLTGRARRAPGARHDHADRG